MVERIIAELNDFNLADYVIQMGLKYKITQSRDSISWYDNVFDSGEINVNSSGDIEIDFTDMDRGRTSVYHALNYMLGRLSEEEQAKLKVLVDDAMKVAESKRKKVIKSRKRYE